MKRSGKEKEAACSGQCQNFLIVHQKYVGTFYTVTIQKTEERYFTMIYKKQYGQPFDTESVVGSFLPMMETIPYLTKEPDGFSYAMEPQDILYGLGENVRGINKRGWVYESKCFDL